MQFSAPREVKVTWDGTEARGHLGRSVFVLAVCVCSGSCAGATATSSPLLLVTAFTSFLLVWIGLRLMFASARRPEQAGAVHIENGALVVRVGNRLLSFPVLAVRAAWVESETHATILVPGARLSIDLGDRSTAEELQRELGHAREERTLVLAPRPRSASWRPHASTRVWPRRSSTQRQRQTSTMLLRRMAHGAG